MQLELKYEAEANAETESTPEFLKAFQEQGLWQVRPRPRFMCLFVKEMLLPTCAFVD